MVNGTQVGEATGMRLHSVPPPVAEHFGVEEVRLRPFGRRVDDLDLDFGAADRAALVTDLLAGCGADLPDGRELFESLPLGSRLEALVLLCLLAGRDEFAWTLTCPGSGCGESVDVSLPLELLAGAAGESRAAGEVEVTVGGTHLRARLPSEADLARWRDRGGSPREMLADLLAAPTSVGDASDATDSADTADTGEAAELSDEVVRAVGEALSEADPLVEVTTSACCPACGGGLTLDVDVEAEALAVIEDVQTSLLRDVASIAWAFHWSEREIVALPPRRRRKYLSLIGLAESRREREG